MNELINIHFRTVIRNCVDQFLHFKDDIPCVHLITVMSTFQPLDVPLTVSSHLPILANLHGIHYLTRPIYETFLLAIQLFALN